MIAFILSVLLILFANINFYAGHYTAAVIEAALGLCNTFLLVKYNPKWIAFFALFQQPTE